MGRDRGGLGVTRVGKGFHRVGVVLAAPFLLLAIGWFGKELLEPTGPIKQVPIDEGTLTQERPANEALIGEQASAGIIAPPGLLVIGRIVRHEQKVGEGPAPQAWAIVELRDGRLIEVSSTETKEVTVAADMFLEAATGFGAIATGMKYAVEFPDKKQLEIRVVRAEQKPGWPAGARKLDWSWTILGAVAALALYLTARAVGWVIDGFLSKPVS
jgi:hypothetical protein